MNYEAGTIGVNSKSFYAEFLDFDINRCDNWVKENVVSKLLFNEHDRFLHHYGGLKRVKDNTHFIKKSLLNWLEQFSDYQIQFICDCGTWDWYWMVQLLAEWETKFICLSGEYKTAEEARCKGCYAWGCNSTDGYKTGLPKLPDNISPVPSDLNDLIAIKKGITPKEAFNLTREDILPANEDGSSYGWGGDKHNALFDANVIKEIYNKLH